MAMGRLYQLGVFNQLRTVTDGQGSPKHAEFFPGRSLERNVQNFLRMSGAIVFVNLDSPGRLFAMRK